MCSCKYYDIMRKSKDKKFIRYQMINHAKEYGIKPTARVFDTNLKLSINVFVTLKDISLFVFITFAAKSSTFLINVVA